MENKKNILYLMILILAISLIIIVISLMYLINKNKNLNIKSKDLYEEYDFSKNLESEKVEKKDINGFQKINDINLLNTIQKDLDRLFETYMYTVPKDSSNEDDRMYMTEEKKCQIIYDMLDKSYIEKNNITKNNCINYVSDIKKCGKLLVKNGIIKYGENVHVCAITAYVEDLNNKTMNEYTYIYRFDTSNQAFSIEPIKGNIEDYLKQEEAINNIEGNDNNYYTIDIMKSNDAAQIYFDHFKYLYTNYPDIIYKNYFEKEYKEKRFGSLNNFKKYVKENLKELQAERADSFFINYEGENTILVIKDKYDNSYKFIINGGFDYKVRLDTYTIKEEQDLQEYNKYSDDKKVANCAYIWIQMLNNRDYSSAYKVLNETFRTSNWESQEEFSKYMYQKFPLHYNIKYNKMQLQGNIYTIEAILEDITGKDMEIKNINLIIKLDEDMDFEMSFNLD